MSIPVRARDEEHFAIVRDSLARDGLHVAMVAHDRDRLQSYAGTLARTLAGQRGLRVEAYHASRLESLVVDVMLNRFDAALSDISGNTRPHVQGLSASPALPGCVLFIPEAQSLPRAEFRQLLRIAAGLRRNGLRLVALFDASHPACDERIAELGSQVARWDLDDEASELIAHTPVTSRLRPAPAANASRWIAAAGIAAMLALLPAALPLAGKGFMPVQALRDTVGNIASIRNPDSGVTHRIEDTEGEPIAATVARSVTRSGTVELAGEPRRDFARAPADDGERPVGYGVRNDAGSELPAAAAVDAQRASDSHGSPAALTMEARSR